MLGVWRLNLCPTWRVLEYGSSVDKIDKRVPALYSTPLTLKAACGSHTHSAGLPSRVLQLYIRTLDCGALRLPRRGLALPQLKQFCFQSLIRERQMASLANIELQHGWRRCTAANHPACAAYTAVLIPWPAPPWHCAQHGAADGQTWPCHRLSRPSFERVTPGGAELAGKVA